MINHNKTTGARREACIKELWGAVPFAWHNVKAHVHKQAVEKHDITGGQFHMLRMIHHGMHHPSALAERSKISRPAVTRLVDALVENELVTRSTDENDRRTIRLELTGRGEILLEEIHKSTHAWLDEKLQSLSDEEIETMTQGFALLRSVFEKERYLHEMEHHKTASSGERNP
jgi:DNA-binding MarR family transcriptional regulator